MKMRKHRFMAILLVCLLCFMMLPVTAFAGAEPGAEGPMTETTEDPVEEPVEDPSEETVEEPTEDTREEPEEPVTEPEYHVEVDELEGYYNEPVELTIRIQDVGGTGWEKVEMAFEHDDPDERTDLTETLLEQKEAHLTVVDNCTVFFYITDLTGTEYMETYAITFFDYDPPVVEAGVRDKLLRVEAVDALSVVAGIYVNDQLYTTLKDGVLDLRIDRCTDELLFFIRAVDRLGNQSRSVVLSNPFYAEPEEDTPEDPKKDCPEDNKDQEQPAETTPTQPAVTTPTQPASAAGTSSGTGTASKPSTTQSSTTETVKETEPVTKEPGEGFSENGNSVTRDLLYDKYTNKQFITITDRDGNTFYLVIDYDSPVNEDEEQYQTYFLNPVDTADLMALIGEETEETVAVCSCTEHCQPGAVNMNCEICAKDMTQCVGKEAVKEPEPAEDPVETEPEEPEETGSGLNPAVLVLLLALVGGGGAFAYFKLVKNKPKTKGNADLDDYDYGDDDYDYEDAPLESEADTDEETDGGDEPI